MFKCAGKEKIIMLIKMCKKSSRGKRSRTTYRKPKTTNFKSQNQAKQMERRINICRKVIWRKN